MRTLISAGFAALLAACATASYEGRGLVPGQSTGADVEKTMGKPAERLQVPGGETVLFYPRAPLGRDTYAARLRPDGTLVSLEQRLTPENFARVVPGKTVTREVRELLGPPSTVTRYALRGGELWSYPVMVNNRLFDFLVQASDDSVVREAYLLHDPVYDAPCPC